MPFLPVMERGQNLFRIQVIIVLPSMQILPRYATQKASVLIATVRVLLESSSGERVPVRAMLDPGAEENFISSSLASQLGLTTRKRPVEMIGLNGLKSNASMETTIRFHSRMTEYSSSTNAIIVPRVTSVRP